MKKKMKKRIEKVVAKEKIIIFDINLCRKLHFDQIKQSQDIVIMQNNLGVPNVLLKSQNWSLGDSDPILWISNVTCGCLLVRIA